MPEHSLVVVSGEDDLVPAHHVTEMVTHETSARLLLAPGERHAAFLFNAAWQETVVAGVWDLIASIPEPGAKKPARGPAGVVVTAAASSPSSPSGSASPRSPPGSGRSSGSGGAAPRGPAAAARPRGGHGHSDSVLSLAMSPSLSSSDLLGGLSGGASRSGSDAGDALGGLDPLLLEQAVGAAAPAPRLRGKGAAGGPPPRCDSALEALRLKGE
jgi:hypothetical protein